jgi:hypothetical protein
MLKLPTPLPLRDAETDFVWVIVPFSRPENLPRVLENFGRQKFPFKKLVLVANGRAGRLASPLVAGWDRLVLTSDAHQSDAKNTALHEIRKRGGGFTVVMDDDDWYGPQFLTEAAGYAKTYDVIGKARHFVSQDGNLWLCSREQCNRPQSWLTGGTIACWAETAPEYPRVGWGEDAEFCTRAERQGMRIFGTDVYHYLYRRTSSSDHAWRISAEDLRAYESSKRALDLGAEDLDIVTGAKLECRGEVLMLHREDADTISPPPPGGSHVFA